MSDTDLYQSLGRVEGVMGEIKDAVGELRDEIRNLPCRDRSGIVPAACPTRRPPTSESPRVTQHDLDNTARIVLAEAAEKAERTFEERLAAIEKGQEDRTRKSRERWDWRLGFAQRVVALVLTFAAGAGVSLVSRCNVAPASVQHRAAPGHDASVTVGAR
jgi:hypothetical protein